MTDKQLAQRKAARVAWGRKYEGTELHRTWTKLGYAAAAEKWGYGRIQSLIDGPNYPGERFSREIKQDIPF